MPQVTVKFQNITPRLFLASVAANSLDKIADLLPNKPKQEIRVAFIPTAADPYNDKAFVKTDRNKLLEMGFDVFDLDIKDKTERELEEELRFADIIFVAGGNTFYLLDQVQKSGFAEVIKRLMWSKRIVYVGSSAGAVLAGPDIKPIEILERLELTPELQSTKALELVDFVVLPHYRKEKYADKFDSIIKQYGNTFDLIPITNDQAVIVEGHSRRIV